MVRASEFRQKEVVNMQDGRRLGPVSDLGMNAETGQIEAIMVPSPMKLASLFKGDRDYVIPWDMIRKIGDDVILVELDTRFWSRYSE